MVCVRREKWMAQCSLTLRERSPTHTALTSCCRLTISWIDVGPIENNTVFNLAIMGLACVVRKLPPPRKSSEVAGAKPPCAKLLINNLSISSSNNWGEPERAPQLVSRTVDFSYIYIYTLLHELACNIASYCTSGRGIFTSRRRVKMQPTSEIIAICMLTSVIKCLLSIPE